MTRPRIDTTFAPAATFAGTRLPPTQGPSPIEKKGPTVCEAVGTSPAEGLVRSYKSFLHGRGFAPAQDNIETISQGKSWTGLLPSKRRYEPAFGIFVGYAVVNGVKF